MQASKTYYSKIDSWLIILFAVIFLVGMIMPLLEGDWLGVCILLPTAAFIIHLLTNTYYTINDSLLIVKSGFLVNTTIDIASIRKIEETNSMISSPAASLDRLEIFYNKYDSVIISPKNKAEFIADILAINNNIAVKYKG